MYPHIAILASAAIIATAFGSPTNLVPRQRGYIRLCSDDLMEGECEDLGITVGTCKELPNRLRDELSSFDTYGYKCLFYTNGNCDGRVDEWTGLHNNLRNTQWNDEKSSVSCTME